jgi:hypothetical protein
VNDYRDFLNQFQIYASQHDLSWAVIGSYAMEAHARKAGIADYREPHDLDLIAILPRHLDVVFRERLDRRSQWVYEKAQLGAIHFWCNDGKQVDIFPKQNSYELDRSIDASVLGLSCHVVCPEDARAALERWAESAKNPGDCVHHKQKQYAADVAWYVCNAALLAAPQMTFQSVK